MNELHATTHFAKMTQTRSGLKIYRPCPVGLGVWAPPNKRVWPHFFKNERRQALLAAKSTLVDSC